MIPGEEIRIRRRATTYPPGTVTCRGGYALGTACRRCARCLEEFSRQVRTEDVRALALEHMGLSELATSYNAELP